MKLKLIPILTVLAILATVTACYEMEQIVDLNARKKDSGTIVKELFQGAAIGGINGINFGPDGNLYVASFKSQSITALNPQNGKVVKKLGPMEGTISPDDLAFGPDGSLYWTDIMVGEVVRMKPDGSVTRQFVALGVNPITFSKDGRLIVGLCFQGDGLYELDPDLIAPPRQIIASTEPNPFPLGFLNAFDFCDQDGMLYGPIFAGGIVVKVDIGEPGDPVSTDPYSDGTVQVISTGFTVPVAAKFDKKGVLHVLDQSGEIFKVNIKTGEKTLLTKIEEGLDNLAFDEKGRLFVSNADFGTVVEILPSGQPRVISRGGMIGPGGMAVLPGKNGQDDLFIADLFRLRQHSGQTGKEINVFKGDLLARPGLLTTPFTVSADGSNLIISSWFGAVVQIWNPETDQVLQSYPVGAPIDAIRFKGKIAVSDLVLGGVIFAEDQSMIMPIDNTNVFAPSGLATDGETLWVADWGTGIVWQIDFSGNTPQTPSVLATGLSNPEGLAWDKKGGLLVVEAGASRLSRIDISTKAVSPVAEGLELSPNPIGLGAYPPSWQFDGVTVGQSGDIYVSGGAKQAVYRISKY